MNAKIDQLFHDALELPDNERATLAARLIDSLDTAMDQDIQAAWAAEIQRRIADLDSGKTRPIPWEEVRRSILRLPDDSSCS